MIRALLVTIACIASVPAFGFFWGAQTTITGYYVYANGPSYITTANNQNPDGCQSSSYFALDTGSPNFKELYATVIAAHVSGSTVTLNYDGCFGQYPRVNSVAVPKVW